MANNVDIINFTPPEAGTPAAEANVSILLNYTKKGEPVSIPSDAVYKLKVNKSTLEVKDPKVVDFAKGSEPVATMLVFPNGASFWEAKNGSETKKYTISGSVQTLIDNFKPGKNDRKIDKIFALYYDDKVNKLGRGWVGNDDVADELSNKVEDISESDVSQLNMLRTFKQITKEFETVNTIDLKYVVIISNGEGKGFGDKKDEKSELQKFVGELKKRNITPVVVSIPAMVDEDGTPTYTNAETLKKLAENGIFLQAKDFENDFDETLHKAYNYIMSHNLLEMTVDASSLNEGTYSFTLSINDDEAEYPQVAWPELAKSKAWLWGLIGGIVFVGLIVFAIIMVKRRNEEDEEDIIEEPQEVCCASCGKVIPKQLFGFKGEFCLSGGKADCPYYQMPDKGKLTITRGALADITFFLKKEVTTIGSNIDNDIYIADKSVSRKHAAIKVDEGKRYEIRDFGSSNGLYINGEKSDRKFLRDGDKIQFGTIETEFKLK